MNYETTSIKNLLLLIADAVDGDREKTAPLCADDIPPTCWIRRAGKNSPDVEKLVIGLDARTLIFAESVGLNTVTFETLHRVGAEYSSDRKTWLPCSKEAR